MSLDGSKVFLFIFSTKAINIFLNNQKIRRGLPDGIGLSSLNVGCFHPALAFALVFPDPPDPEYSFSK